jgi:hypothetical protein
VTRRAYVTPARLAELAAGLTPQERILLGHVATMRLASVAQLQRLHGVAGAAAVRRFRRLLARLTEKRLLGRLERRIGGVRAGSAGFVYRLDPPAGLVNPRPGGQPAVRRPGRRPGSETPDLRNRAGVLAVIP